MALTVYADTSLLVPLFARDAFNNRVRQFLASRQPALIVSDFACAELVSTLGIKVRRHQVTLAEARAALVTFDTWMARRSPRVETSAGDIRLAEMHLRRLDLPLRAPDVVHIAIAQRHGVQLATFDTRMAAAAQALGLQVAPT